MKIQDRFCRIKRTFFTALVEIRCFDLNSYTILILVCLIRFITEMTIVDFLQFIGDYWFTFLFEAQQLTNIFQQLQPSIYQFCGIIFILVTCLAYFYCLFTLKSVQKTIRVKTIYLKGFSLIVYTFRVFLVKAMCQIILINFQQNNVEFIVIASLVTVCLILVMFVLEEFYVSISLQSSIKSLLAKSPHPFNLVSEGILLGIVILSQFLPENNIFITSGLCAAFILSYILKLLTSTLRKKYHDSLMESIQKIHCMSGIVFYLLVIPGCYIELLRQNLLVSDIIVIIFCMASYSNYLSQLRNQGINFLESSVKSKEELQARKGKFYLLQAHYLIHYVNYLMTQYKGEKQQILLSGIFSQHVRSCKSPQCFCSKLSQTNTVQKLMMERDFRGKFLLSFVDNIYNEFSHQFDIFSVYLMFKLQVIGIFPEIENSMIKYENINHSHLKIGQEFILFQIRRSLRKTIEERNRQFGTIKLQNVIQQEEKCKYLINLMKSIVQLTVKKFHLLGEAITNLKLVEQNVDKTSSMIKQIELDYLESIGKNSYNLYTQSLFYQYYTSISQTNSQASTILSNIIIKSNGLKALKGITHSNMEKFIYQDNCCIIQASLEPDNMGHITNLNENSQHVFGIKKKQLIFQNIKKLIPKQFNDEHQKLMKLWLSTASYQNINQLKNIYLTNQKNIAFKSVIYHQITTSFERIKFYVMVLKMNGDNFLLVDEGLKIQGFGQKIKDSILTLKTLKQPLINFCLNPRVLPQDIHHLESDKEYKIDLLLCQEKGNFGQIKTYDSSANLAQQIQQFAMKVLQSSRQLRVLKCKVSMFVMTFGNVRYLVMKLIDVIQHTMLQSDIEQMENNSQYFVSGIEQGKGTSKNLGRQKVLLGQNSFTIKNLQDCPQNENEEFIDDNQESATEINSEDDHLMKNYQLQEMQKQSTSSVSRESVGYSFKKLIKLIKEKFFLQKNVTYRQLNNITLVLCLLLLIIFAALISQYVFYKSKLQTFQSILNANQQVSDTLQYVQLLFSQSILIYQNCVALFNQFQCQQAVTWVSFSYNNLFDQVAQQTQNFMTANATSDFPFYQYLNEQVNVSLGKSQSNLTIQQFLSVFYYSVKNISLHFDTSRTMNSQMTNFFSILVDNWDLIVNINHQILAVYQQKGLQQMNLISIILFSITGGLIFLNFLVVTLINYFIGKTIDKRQKLIRNYQYVPISYVEEMKKYFQTLLDTLNEHRKSKLPLKQQEFPCIEESPYYRPRSQFFYSRTYVKRLLLLLTFFMFLTGSNIFSLFEMRQVLQPFQIIFIEESNMISSQKKVIQALYQLKMDYFLITNDTIRGQRLSILESGFEKKQVEFNDRAIKLLEIFNDPTSQYYQDFKHLLKDDICDISQPIISQWEYNACKNAQFEYPKYGIFSTMNLIQRATMNAYYVLKGLPPQAAPMFFSNPMFQEIDLYIVYTVKVFYLMESRINQQMQTSLSNAYFTCLLLIMLQFFFLMCGVLTWIWFYKTKVKQFIKLYGHVIIFPNQVIIKNKLIMKSIEQELLIKDY